MFLWPTVPAAGYFFDVKKSNQKTVGTYGFQTSLMHPVIVFAIPGHLPGYRAMTSDVPSAGRPLFFIQEKKRRPPSSLKAEGIRNLLHPSKIKLSSIIKQRTPVSREGDGAASFQDEKQRSGTEAITWLPGRLPWMAAAF